jgi:hypothetical protein
MVRSNPVYPTVNCPEQKEGRPTDQSVLSFVAIFTDTNKMTVNLKGVLS